MRIAILVAFFIVLLANDHSLSQIFDNSMIKLALDKTEYYRGETVNLSIKNNSQDTLIIWNSVLTPGFLKLRRTDGLKWEELIIQNYSGGLRGTSPHKFSPGEEILYQWDQKYNIYMHTDSTKRIDAPLGKYKFGFLFSHYQNDSNVNYSEEFELK